MSNPIKPNLKTEALPASLSIITIVLTFYFYAHYPEIIASHWNFAGEVDGYMGKTAGAFLLPGIVIGIYLLMLFLPFLDPKKERYTEFRNVYHIFKGSLVATMFLVFLFTGLYNIGYDINIGIIIPSLIGVLFIILGNYMGKIKNNWFMGIRTPWTMSSENVWNKTHRLGGIIFMIFGVLIIISPHLPETLALTAFIIGIASMIIPIIYSYVLYRKEKKDITPVR